MTLVATGGYSFYPTIPHVWNTTGGTETFTFDTSTDQTSLIFQIPLSGTIDKIHYRIAARTSPIMTRRIEMRTVDTATGLPNTAGTLYGGGTTITVDATTDTANTNMTAAVAVTATAGDVVAIVHDLSAFTSGSFTLQDRALAWLSAFGPANSTRVSNFPYAAVSTAGTLAISPSCPTAWALEYSGGVFVAIPPNIGCTHTSDASTITSSGSIRRIANAFTPTTPRRAVGIYCFLDNDDAAGLLRLRKVSDDSILATCTIDTNVRGINAGVPSYFLFDSAATVTLVAGTAYYITAEASDATGMVVQRITNIPSQAMLATQPGGSNCYGATHNGTSWTALTGANATARYMIGLITDQEDDGAGGGGLLTHPGMSGGMRG